MSIRSGHWEYRGRGGRSEAGERSWEERQADAGMGQRRRRVTVEQPEHEALSPNLCMVHAAGRLSFRGYLISSAFPLVFLSSSLHLPHRQPPPISPPPTPTGGHQADGISSTSGGCVRFTNLDLPRLARLAAVSRLAVPFAHASRPCPGHHEGGSIRIPQGLPERDDKRRYDERRGGGGVDLGRSSATEI
jgi:hypothetical protein